MKATGTSLLSILFILATAYSLSAQDAAKKTPVPADAARPMP